jgi:hypothetical protein
MIYRMLCLFYINLYNSSTLSPIYRLFSTRVSVCIVLNHRTPLLDESVLKDCHIDFICKLVPCSAVRGFFCRYLQLAVWLQVNQFIMSSIFQFLSAAPHLKVLLRGIQLTFVQRFQQLYFLIHYCCNNTWKVGRATHVLASFKVKILHDNTISTVEYQ